MKTAILITTIIALALSASAQTLGDNYPLPSTGTLRLRQATGTGGAGGGIVNTNPATVPMDVQTAITDLLNGLPLSTDMRVSPFGVATGAGLRGGQLENFIDAAYNFNGAITTNANYVTSWGVLAGIEIGPGASIIDRGTLRAKYGLAWINAEIGADAGVMLNWTPDNISPKTGPQAVFGLYGTTRALTGIFPYVKLDFLLNRSQPVNKAPAFLLGVGVKIPIGK